MEDEFVQPFTDLLNRVDDEFVARRNAAIDERAAAIRAGLVDGVHFEGDIRKMADCGGSGSRGWGPEMREYAITWGRA